MTVTDHDPVAVDDAIRHLRSAAFTTEGGRTIIHTYAGGLGADWDLADAEQFLRDAVGVWWGPNIVGHDLAAKNPEGRVIRFDVTRPGDDR